MSSQVVEAQLRKQMEAQGLTPFQVAKRTGIPLRKVRLALEGMPVSVTDALKLSVGLAKRVG